MKTNQKKAAAIRYDAEATPVPQLTAKGKGPIAEQIIRLAREHQVPIVEDADLLQLLMQLDVFDYIPEKLYEAVAEVLAFVYRMNRSYAQSKK